MLKKISFQDFSPLEVILINQQLQKNRYLVHNVSFQRRMNRFSAAAYRYNLNSHEQFYYSDASKAKAIDSKG